MKKKKGHIIKYYFPNNLNLLYIECQCKDGKHDFSNCIQHYRLEIAKETLRNGLVGVQGI